MCTKCSCLLAVVLIFFACGLAPAELVARWTLDAVDGTVVPDSGPYGFDGTVAAGSPTAVPGMIGGALEFHGLGAAGGGGDYIDCGSNDTLDITSNISITLWIRPDAENPEDNGTETAPMAKAMNGMSPSWSYQVRYGWGSTEPYMAFTFNTTPRAWAYVGQNLEQGEWCHIACSHDGSTLRCYLNGEETGSTDMGEITSSSTPVLIGSDGWGCDWIGCIDDVRIYNHGLTAEEILQTMMDGGPELAKDPVPADEETDVLRDADLSWTAGKYAATHDVYLGTVFDDVNNVTRADAMDLLVSESQADTTYDPGRLEYGTTYFWRIDEVNAAPDNTIYQGKVWSFSTEPMAYPVEGVVATSNGVSEPGSGPDKMVDGSGLNAADQHSTNPADMWLAVQDGADPIWVEFDLGSVAKLYQMEVWNYNGEFELILGFGLKDISLEYSVDGAEWTSLGDVELTQGTARADYTGSAVDLQGVAARYVRLTVNSAYSVMGQYGLSEVRFLTVPVQARLPEPAADANEVAIDTELTWRAGREAASHEIYLDAVDATTLVGTTTDSSFAPSDLLFGSTYYWKVTEVNEAEAIASWTSPVWSFLTQEYATIEGFEAYDDDENRIYDTWLDGWVNDTGSTVGYMEEPFAEQTIVNSGKQSLPLIYSNGASPYYSETSRTWTSALDLTAGGADSLRLYVQGVADNDPDTLYVAVEDTSGDVAVAVNADEAVLTTASWQAWTIPFADLAGVNLAAVRTITIGVGDRDNPSSGGSGTVYIDDLQFGNPVD